MINRFFATDERTERINGRISLVFLLLTQVGLLAAMLHKAYVRQLPPEEYNDLRIILALSVFGYLAARLYYGGLLPVFSLKKLLLVYAGLVAFLLATISIWLGFPEPSEWANTLLPVIVGPAIVLGLYTLIAHLGQKRIEKELS